MSHGVPCEPTVSVKFDGPDVQVFWSEDIFDPVSVEWAARGSHVWLVAYESLHSGTGCESFRFKARQRSMHIQCRCTSPNMRPIESVGIVHAQMHIRVVNTTHTMPMPMRRVTSHSWGLCSTELQRQCGMLQTQEEHRSSDRSQTHTNS